jgi:hypothetical protein
MQQGQLRSCSQDCEGAYAIIDGKQRLQAIFDFMSNDLRLNDNCRWRFDNKLELGGLYYCDLEERYPQMASIIDDYIIDVMSVSTDDQEDINTIFKRLNKGDALTGAEVRNAALGPVADMIRVVAKHDFFIESVSFSTKRLGDFNAAAKVLLFEHFGFPTSTKKKDLDRFVDEMNPDKDRIESAGLKCLSHLNLMFQAFQHRDSVLRSSGQIPVYYWLVRLTPRESHGAIRSFLMDFDARRADNRNLQTENRLDEVDPILSRYDVLNRNTNDAGSHRARISILLDQFVEWLREVEGEQKLALEVRGVFKDFSSEMRERFGHDWT